MKSGITTSFVNWVHEIKMKPEKVAIIEYKEFQEWNLWYTSSKKKEPRHPNDVLFFVLPWLWLKNILQILVMIY